MKTNILQRLAGTALAAIFPLFLAALASSAQAALPEVLRQQLAAAQIPEDAVSVVVLRGETTLLAHGELRPMNPASTMKLVTTQVALDQLGPIFRGRTEMLAAGDVVKGVLQGDLILRGGADADFNTEALTAMLQSLRNQGIRKIAGRLVLDRSLFQPVRSDIGLPPFDNTPEARYNVIPDALLLNMNLLQLELRSSSKDVQVFFQPALQGVSVSADMQMIGGSCEYWKAGWKPAEYVKGSNGKLKIVLHGSFPRNCVAEGGFNLIERDDYLARAFHSAWSQLGGSITGPTVPGQAPADATVLAEHQSRALPEVIRDTNKISDNVLARTLYLSLGSLEADPVLGSRPLAPLAGADTVTRSGQAIHQWMQSHHIDDHGLVIENGSGLSRVERISARQMAAVLKVAEHGDWAPEYVSSLPIVALDGTMRRRLKGSPAAARARLKTGAINQVVAIAGYVPDAHNQQCVVVAMINHEKVVGGAGRAMLDALVDWVARLEN